MEDERIIALYWARAEEAISQTAQKYGAYLHRIAWGILQEQEDARECVNDTYYDAWNAIPPHRPAVLSAFLGRITRRIAIDRWRKNRAQKRGGGELVLALEELAECADPNGDPVAQVEKGELAVCIAGFVAGLPELERRVFLSRYWYLEPVDTIAKKFGFSRSKVASMLHRIRGKLRRRLEQEGYL